MLRDTFQVWMMGICRSDSPIYASLLRQPPPTTSCSIVIPQLRPTAFATQYLHTDKGQRVCWLARGSRLRSPSFAAACHSSTHVPYSEAIFCCTSSSAIWILSATAQYQQSYTLSYSRKYVYRARVLEYLQRDRSSGDDPLLQLRTRIAKARMDGSSQRSI